MSSHHIVRENQEPALVILDAHAIPFEKVQELLEWMPTIIVLHSQIETVMGWGIKIDVVLVPASEEAVWVDRTKEQQPIEIVSFRSNESAIDNVISFLKSKNIPAVNWLVSDTETLLMLSDFKGDTEVFINNIRWSRVKSGRFEKWLPKGTVLHCFPKDACSEFFNSRFSIEKNGVVGLNAGKLFWVGEEIVN
jgi:thiamine pyrophosphokinase